MSADARLILVAKAVAAELRADEVSLLSTESSASPGSFTQEEIFALSPAFSNLYADLIEAIKPLLTARGVPSEAAGVILRDAAPTAAHLALDRAMRLSRFIAARGRGGLAVSSPAQPAAYARPEALRDAAVSSREFNEFIIGRLAPAVGLPAAEWRPSPQTPVLAAGIGKINYNFHGRGLMRRLRGRVYRLAARLWPGKAPALSLSYATDVLQDSGFFGFGFLEYVRGRVAFPPSTASPTARAELAQVLEAFTPRFEAFFPAGEDRTALSRAVAAVFVEVFPSDALEGAAAHHRAASEFLEGFPPTALMMSETGNVEATFLLAAARARGLETIGMQEGGTPVMKTIMSRVMRWSTRSSTVT
ncbi:MAG: hypothetical protein M0D55_02055 [Elusimicrobiota bacterium]|nr:MAG: hypothetical protein M0D55_02055 [Elusimicrobiota bacterium]